jgi:hypothetical protein
MSSSERLINMEDALASKLSHLMSIHHLKRRTAANIKRLKEV